MKQFLGQADIGFCLLLEDEVYTRAYFRCVPIEVQHAMFTQ
jgi:hypothetical protein